LRCAKVLLPVRKTKSNATLTNVALVNVFIVFVFSILKKLPRR
jgi:hypothetical protein